MLKINATSPPTISIVVTAATISIDKFKKGRMAMAAQATNEATKKKLLTDSGFDLHAIEEVIIPAFGRALVPTGLSFDIKDGYEIQVRSKSGLAINQGLMILNSPGTVDNGYTGEVKGIIFNTNNHPVTITKGMKIGQAVLCPVVNGKWVNLVQKNNITEKDRGSNGFGSTGI